MASFKPPGRLGDPSMALETDPRVYPDLLQAMKCHNLHQLSYLTSELSADSPLDSIISFVSKNEEAINSLYNRLDYDVPGDPNASVPLTKLEESIPGPDSNTIRLTIYRPSDVSSETPLPAVLYLHGGGMVILKTDNTFHVSWTQALARTGMIAILVDFRNALRDSNISSPFPAGLNDCAAAVRWVHAHRADLNISKIVLQGESGGANLAFATTIKAKREGWLQSCIAGVCASVPYISNAYGMPLAWQLANLPSLVESDGYLISCGTSVLNARLYDPAGEHARDPLAWPYWASEEDLRDLPPHLIVTSELDPLRDEGNAYYKKLINAGVRAVGKINLGIVHVGELMFRQALPDLFLANLWEIKRFIDGC